MYLFIDNSGEQAELVLSMDKKSIQLSARPKEQLPALLERLLKKANIKLAGLKGAAVIIGKGRFTATRIAVTFANTLAYALKIPVVGVTNKEDWCKKISMQSIGIYVSAVYSGEAHISGKQEKL